MRRPSRVERVSSGSPSRKQKVVRNSQNRAPAPTLTALPKPSVSVHPDNFESRLAHMDDASFERVMKEAIFYHINGRRIKEMNNCIEDMSSGIQDLALAHPSVSKSSPSAQPDDNEITRAKLDDFDDFERAILESEEANFLGVCSPMKDSDFDPVALGRAPPPRTVSEELMDAQNLSCAQAGISFLNHPSNLDLGVGEYELVKPQNSTIAISPTSHVTHANFEAKPKNCPDAEPTVFFVELLYEKVSICRALGPSGSASAATGPNGCRLCSYINHPHTRDFFSAR